MFDVVVVVCCKNSTIQELYAKNLAFKIEIIFFSFFNLKSNYITDEISCGIYTYRK